MGYFDAHNHLQDERWGGRQEELVRVCREAGVTGMVVNGSCEADWPQVAALARRWPDLVLPAFGLHPWYVSGRSATWMDTLRTWLDEFPRASVGEIGLDRWILDGSPAAQRALRAAGFPEGRGAPLEEQREVFRAQWQLAAERHLPATVHCLQAWGALVEIARDAASRPVSFLLHSYGGAQELVPELASLGAYFSFPGYSLHARKVRQREAFRAVPEDRLLAETDAPDQRLPGIGAHGAEARAPEAEDLEPLVLTDDSGGALNHPANLPQVYRALARLRGVALDTLEKQLERNAGSLFGPAVAGRR